MTDLDIVKENDNYRARLEYDESGEKPYDEGATPILNREFRGYARRWEAVNEQANEYVDTINDAYTRFDYDEDVLARFLRIFYGSYSVLWDSSQENAYLAFDTAAWRETHGLTDEYIAKVGPDVLDRQTLAEGSLNEIMAWANGEVFGFIVERKVKAVTTRTDYATGEPLPSVEFEEWDEVDACWGFFGRESAVEAAIESFDHYSDN